MRNNFHSLSFWQISPPHSGKYHLPESMRDFYCVLGVQPGANQDEIKAAFRKLALLHHPDRHTSSSAARQAEAAAIFKNITEAYDVLTDDRKRAQYDASFRPGGGSSTRARGSTNAGSSAYGSWQNTNTDWANSRYTHQYGRTVRLSWFQELQRAVGARKLEAGFGFAALGLLLFGCTAVDAVWSARNQGKSFADMQAARMATAAAATPVGASGEVEGADVDLDLGGSQRAKPYSPPVGCSNRPSRSLLQQRMASSRRGPDAQERQLAEMPLADFIAAEERAASGRGQMGDRVTGKETSHEAEYDVSGQGPRQGEVKEATGGQGLQGEDGGGARWVGGLSAGAGKTVGASGPDAGAAGMGPYVDRAVLMPGPNPPGQMAGHRPR